MNTQPFPRFIAHVILLGLVCLPPGIGAATVHVGELIDDPGYSFDSFGNNVNDTTRGANFGGTSATTWYGVSMTTDSSGATNGISWTGSVAEAVDGTLGYYNYTGNTLTGGSDADANHITNTGIHGSPTVTITTTQGNQYSVDLLFANSFSDRTFDVNVDGQLYLDDFAINVNYSENEDRPQVYRFDFLAAASSMTITLTPGAASGYTDTNPFVHAVLITHVPELSAILLMELGGVAFLASLPLARRRLHRY